MPFAPSDGIKLYYEMRGEQGSPVLMINGYGASLIGWYAPFVDALAACHRVVLFDNRGAGKSDKPDEPYSMAQFADDAAAVLDAAEITSAHVFSASMGGMIAQNFALRHPDRVRGLVLGCTIPAGMGNPHVTMPSPETLAILTAPRGADPAQDIRNLWPILNSPHYIEKQGDYLERKLQETITYPRPPQYALEHQMHAVEHTHDVVQQLEEIRCPTVVMTGDADILVPPENSRFIASRIPNARLIEYAGAAHDFIQEAGEAVSRDALAFFAQVDEDRSSQQ